MFRRLFLEGEGEKLYLDMSMLRMYPPQVSGLQVKSNKDGKSMKGFNRALCFLPEWPEGRGPSSFPID